MIAILDTLRQIATRLGVVEITHRRGAHLDDISDDDTITKNPNPEPIEDQDEARLLRVMTRANA